MKYFICILLAYLIGSLSPSALLAKIKHKNLKKEGTGNLGATNTTLVFGKMFGFLVMVLDIFKGFLAVKITAWIVPEVEWLAILAGFCAVIGHCFPFYLKFKGGKGLAAFGGVILAYNPLFFLFVFDSVELKEYLGDGVYGERFDKSELLEKSIDEEDVWMPINGWSADNGMYISK